jgi:hypothetical protein
MVPCAARNKHQGRWDRLDRMEARVRKLFAILLLATAGYPVTAPARTPDKALLRSGVYTTAEISRRCQNYVNRRVPDTRFDRSRNAVFMACVQRLSANASSPSGGPVGYGSAPPMVEAPVALPAYGGGWSGLDTGLGACSTDEGYGRRGRCDAM